LPVNAGSQDTGSVWNSHDYSNGVQFAQWQCPVFENPMVENKIAGRIDANHINSNHINNNHLDTK